MKRVLVLCALIAMGLCNMGQIPTEPVVPEFNADSVIAGEFVYAYAKRGDILSTDPRQSFRNGYIVEVIDPNDEGWHNSIAAKQKELHRALTPAEMEDLLFPVAGKMRRAYSIIRAKRGSALALRLKASTAPTTTDTASADYRIKSGFLDYAKLEQSMQIPGLRNKAGSPDVMDILDGEKLPANVLQLAGSDTGAVIKDPRSQVPEQAHDFNVISKGEWTCGTAGSYATVTAAFADVTTLDSALTFVVISSHTITASATSTVVGGGFTFTLRNHADGAHNGSLTAGYIISVNANAAGVYLNFNNSVNVISGLSMKRITTNPTTPAHLLIVYRTTTACLTRVSNCVFNGNGIINSEGLSIAQNVAGSYVGNILVVGTANYGISSGNIAHTVENSTVIGGAYGFYMSGASKILRNCVATGQTTAGYYGTATNTGYNNASTDTSCSNASWATGSGNRVSIVAATEFESVDPTSAYCGRLKKSVLYNAGIAPTYAGATDLAGWARPGRDAVYAIGAFEYDWLYVPGLVGIAPNYARGDSTKPLPDTTGDQIKFWFTGDSVKAGKFLNNALGDTGIAHDSIYQVAEGRIGNCIRLKGSNDSLVWADRNEYDVTGQATVLTWAKQVAATGNGFVISKANAVADNSGYSVFWNQGTNLITTYGCNPSTNSTAGVLTNDVWQFLSVTWANSVLFKVNNVSTNSQILGGPAVGTNSLTIGTSASNVSTSYCFNGWVDRTLIADTAINVERQNTYYISNRDRLGQKDTTTGLFYTDTAGTRADTLWFAVGDTTTWRKYPVEADNVYNLQPYLTSGVVNTVYERSSNNIGVSGVTAYSVFADMEPVIDSIAPISGPAAGATSVRLYGTRFYSARTTGTITFGGTAVASYTSWGDSQIVAVTPAHAAGLVNVILTNSAGLADTATYTYVSPDQAKGPYKQRPYKARGYKANPYKQPAYKQGDAW